jgi:hypothetical protein
VNLRHAELPIGMLDMQPEIGQPAKVAEGKTVFVCEGCGESYDILLRGIEGEFHFFAVSVDAEPDGTVTVIGHWHAGTFVEDQVVELKRRDGHAVAIDSVTMRPPVSEASGRKGQRILTVRTPHPESFHAGGCIRPEHP